MNVAHVVAQTPSNLLPASVPLQEGPRSLTRIERVVPIYLFDGLADERNCFAFTKITVATDTALLVGPFYPSLLPVPPGASEALVRDECARIAPSEKSASSPFTTKSTPPWNQPPHVCSPPPPPAPPPPRTPPPPLPWSRLSTHLRPPPRSPLPPCSCNPPSPPGCVIQAGIVDPRPRPRPTAAAPPPKACSRALRRNMGRARSEGDWWVSRAQDESPQELCRQRLPLLTSFEGRRRDIHSSQGRHRTSPA